MKFTHYQVSTWDAPNYRWDSHGPVEVPEGLRLTLMSQPADDRTNCVANSWLRVERPEPDESGDTIVNQIEVAWAQSLVAFTRVEVTGLSASPDGVVVDGKRVDDYDLPLQPVRISVW